MRNVTALLAALMFIFVACDDDDDDPLSSVCDFADESSYTTLEFSASDSTQDIIDAVNDMNDKTRIVLGAGNYVFTNAITIRNNDIIIEGAGKDESGGTTLDFDNAVANTNGIDVVGDNFIVRDLAVTNAQKDAIRVEDSECVVFQRVLTTWDNENDSTNGAYGLYPVKSKYILMEDSEAYNTADAGIYVGQSEYAIIRRNIASRNVAGIEIENTIGADVYENTATDNTGGLLIFDLPGNEIAGSDVLIRDNIVTGNNRENFAPGGTVAEIPPGTGTFVMASRRVEIRGNTYGNNNTIDIAVLSGYLIESNTDSWEPLGNFYNEDIYIHSNTFQGNSGDDPACLSDLIAGDARACDQLLGAITVEVYNAATGTTDFQVDNIWYDGLGGSSIFDGPDSIGLGNNLIGLCVGDNEGAPSFVDLNILGNVDIESEDLDLQFSQFLQLDSSDYDNFDCVGQTISTLDEI